MAKWLPTWAHTLLYGPVPQHVGEAMPSVALPAPATPLYTSPAFEAHILAEATYAARTTAGVRGNLAISKAWDQTEGAGIRPDMRLGSSGQLTEFDRKETLLQAYLQSPWISSCVDVIAKRITSGGFTVEATKQGEGSDSNRQTILDFLLFINEDWDFLQLVRSIITDLLIFGEAYCEILWQGSTPYQLVKVDCLTITYKLDPHGTILGYEQRLAHSTETVPLDVKNIIRWWLPSPYASMIALSPIERCLDAMNLDKKMVNFVSTFFQKGAKVPFWVETKGDEDEATRFLEWFRENYTGEKNAHMPITTWGETLIHEFQKGAVDIDFIVGREVNREEILGVFGVPPAMVNLIESGNIGGGSGEDQEKSFQYNTCDPIKQVFFEKFNYRIIWKGFQMRDYLVTTRYADYRNSESVAKVQDMRIRNGSITINEARQEAGKEPYKDGGDIAIIVTTKEITPVPRLDSMEDEQAQQTQITLQQAQAQAEQAEAAADLAKTQAAKAKEPPQPVPTALQQSPQGNEPPAAPAHSLVTKPANTASNTKTPQQNAKESLRPAVVEEQTSIMVALYPSTEVADSLAIPGGEPASELHITLAFLGDSNDLHDDCYNPVRSPFYLKAALDAYATRSQPLSGYITGVSRFDGDDESYPVIAVPEVPTLATWREGLVQAIGQAGYFVDMTYPDYHPHITLAYVPQGLPSPLDYVPNLPLAFDALWLVIGNERTPFPFASTVPDGGNASESVRESSVQTDLADEIAALFDDVTRRGNEVMKSEDDGE